MYGNYLDLYQCLWTYLCLESMFMTWLQWSVLCICLFHQTVLCWGARHKQCSITDSDIFVFNTVQISSVAQSCPTLCGPMNRSTPGLPVHHQLSEFTHSCPSSQWCHPAISSSIVPVSSCPQALPPSKSFTMSQLFAWGRQSTGAPALASFLPKKSQGWSPSEWTGWISLPSKGLSRVFSNTAVQKHQFFSAQASSQSNSHIHTWPQEKP